MSLWAFFAPSNPLPTFFTGKCVKWETISQELSYASFLALKESMNFNLDLKELVTGLVIIYACIAPIVLVLVDAKFTRTKDKTS